MNALGKLAIACVTVLTAAPLAAAEPQVVCELDRDRIYLGESVRYQVTLNHVENPSPPELVGFDDFDVASAGEQDLNSSRITIINGRRSEIIRRGRAYLYVLTPRRAGRLTVPAAVVRIDGRVLRGESLSLEVREPDSQNTVLMEITADPPTVYPTERFTVTLSVLVRALPGELADRNPVSIQQTPPRLQIPWLADAQLPEGLAPVESDRAWLSQLRDLRGEGFGINNVSDSSVFSIFERRALAFQPTPRRAIRKNAAGESVDYWVYEFRRTYTANRDGRYTFGPASVKGTFATDLSASGRLSGEQIHAIAPRLDVDVKQVPEAGRPANYLGAIGRFDWSAELRPTTCRVGDPITLTLTLRGRGSLDATTPPDLAEVPTVAANFKTYEGTREVKGDTCRFTYTLRPLNENRTEFPSIAGSYFDVATGRYVTLETKPIPIDVKKADALADAQIIGPAGGNRTSGELKVQSEGISANITDPAQLRNQSVYAEAWLAGAAGLAGLYGLIAAGTWYARRRWSDAALMRRRAATGRARRRLHDAVALLHAHVSRQGAEGVRGALVGLVADVADLPEAGMTSADACRRLQGLGVEQPLVDRLARALETCDATRYAAGSAEMNGLADEAGSLLDGVVRSLKKQRCLR